MVPYQSEEAKQALGKSYRPGRPNAAFLVRPNGEIARGLDAFLALLPGLKGGRVLSVLLSLPLVKPFGYLLYWFVARYRYSIFGKVPLAGVSKIQVHQVEKHRPSSRATGTLARPRFRVSRSVLARPACLARLCSPPLSRGFSHSGEYTL